MKMPDRYQIMKSMPDDPPFSCTYGYKIEEAGCFVMVYPIPLPEAMPFNQPDLAIKGIHEVLGENQGLIAVETGKTSDGQSFIYSIVKTLKKPHGVQYCLTMHVEYEGYAVQVQGFFDEVGMTGFRDSMVFSWVEPKGIVEVSENGIKGWNADPYQFRLGFSRGVPRRRNTM